VAFHTGKPVQVPPPELLELDDELLELEELELELDELPVVPRNAAISVRTFCKAKAA
jgi:hypothetical protein